MYARSLSRLALVLAVLYVLLIVSAAIPLKLLDYDWINRVTASLINGAGLPLLALLVLVVGSEIYPDHPLLLERRALFARLAGVAAFGFLLLIPLHIYMGFLQHAGIADEARALDTSERRVDAYRRAANQATSVADLQSRLTKLNAPPINPEILSRPLPEVKAQAGAAFNQVAAQIARQRQAFSEQSNLTGLAVGVFRIVCGSLVLAFGFAGFAQANPDGPSMMDRIEMNTSSGFEVLRGWQHTLTDLPARITNFLFSRLRGSFPGRQQNRPPSSQPHKARPKSQRQFLSEDYDYIAAITPEDPEER
ncbi:MAG: hypothetical protein VKO39_00010 [Cyanobacteriota bacterium]|nr:hypothetical protein [Cyanobacteriota bacterium]